MNTLRTHWHSRLIAIFLLCPLFTMQLFAEGTDKTKEKYAKFEKLLSGAKLVGKFTILGRDPAKLPKEEYTIKSVKKMPQGDKWLFTANVKYGNLNVTLPFPLDVKWAGDTPLITMTNVTIPTLGTFSCRVLFYNGKYAGTWTHGKVGGHMFGTIERASATAKESGAEDKKGK